MSTPRYSNINGNNLPLSALCVEGSVCDSATVARPGGAESESTVGVYEPEKLLTDTCVDGLISQQPLALSSAYVEVAPRPAIAVASPALESSKITPIAKRLLEPEAVSSSCSTMDEEDSLEGSQEGQGGSISSEDVADSMLSLSCQASYLPPPPGLSLDVCEETTGGIVVLRLEEAIAEPPLGSPALPTLGSRSHRQGNCHPCAFVFKGGCANGIDCRFCHLCENGEKKRRKKEQKVLRRALDIAVSSTCSPVPE